MKRLIVLDPGHGGADPGALNGKRLEKDDNLRMASAVRDLLGKQGHDVLLTRSDDTNPSYSDRIGLANTTGADLFLSVHRNSWTNSTPKGIEIYARYHPHLPAMATILEQLATHPHQGNRGAKLGAYKVLLGASMPAGLIEIGFISNAEDNRLYDAHFDAYAEAIARGVCYALGEPYIVDDMAPVLYRIQVGAFTNKEYAEAYMQKIQADGYPAFMIDPTPAEIAKEA